MYSLHGPVWHRVEEFLEVHRSFFKLATKYVHCFVPEQIPALAALKSFLFSQRKNTIDVKGLVVRVDK